MFKVVRNPSVADFWVQALRKKVFRRGPENFLREDYDDILGNYLL